jgi:hypothetical protein
MTVGARPVLVGSTTDAPRTRPVRTWQYGRDMAGVPRNPACGGLERRASSRTYIDHIMEAHPLTLRKIGFADVSSLEELSKYPLRRIHHACVEREALEAQNQEGRAQETSSDERDVG